MEVGWVLHPDLAGQGFATESLRGLIEYLTEAFSEVSRFEARVGSTDEGAKKVLERLGFIGEGTLRGGFNPAGQRTDSIMFGMLRGELTQ
jgi:RimJ/RimL family protein N-acetyltransferase